MCCGGVQLEMIPANERTVERVMAHAGAPVKVSPEQNEALLDEETKNRILLAFKTYLWADRDGKAVCTRCGMESYPQYAAHKATAYCPHCGAAAEMRLTRYGRKHM